MIDFSGTIDLINGVTDAIGRVRALIQGTGAGERAEIAEALLQAREDMLTVKEQVLALRDELSQLQEEKRRMERAMNQLDDYKTARFGRNTTALIQKTVTDPNKPGHLCCANCARKIDRVILSFEEETPGYDVMRCPECKTAVFVPNDIKPPRTTVDFI